MATTPFAPEHEFVSPQPEMMVPEPQLVDLGDEADFRPLIADRYEVVNTQAGGMGLVHLCRDQLSNELVALKTFKPEYLPNRAARDLFLREGTMWVQIGRHPHIVHAYRVERIGDGREIYLVLEWIVQPPDRDKPSLRSWMYPGRPLPVDTAVLFALHIARGMRYATQKIPGLVHRDLKPENVLVGFDGNARVTDFGLARTLSGIGEDQSITVSTSSDNFLRTQLTQGAAGTPLYMSPEQWLGQRLDARADIYALGCILYEMVTGHYAAKGNSRAALKTAHISGRIDPPPAFVPREVSAFLQRCMMNKRNHRLRSWQEVEESLVEVFTRITGTPPPEEKTTMEISRAERLTMGHSYSTMGRSYLDIGKLAVAVMYFEQAVWIGREEQSLELEGSGLGNLGLAYFALGYIERAIEFYQEQLAIARQTGSQIEEASALGNLGTGYRHLGELERAITFHEKEMAIAQDLQNQYMEAAALDHLGDAYRRQGDLERAVTFYKQSLAIARHIEDQARVRSVLRNMGQVYLASADTKEAMTLFRQSLKIAQKLGDRVGEGESLSDIANLYQKLGYELEALDYHNRALHIAEESSDWRGMARSRLQLGDLYLAQGKAEQAVIYYQQGLAAVKEIGDQSQEQQILAKLGQAHFKLGDYMESASLQRRALHLAQEQDNVKAEKAALRALGRSYEAWGDLGRTALYYEQYLTISQEQRDLAGELLMLETLGDVYVRARQYKPARSKYERYLMRRRKSGKATDLLRVLAKLGDVLRALLETKSALEVYELGLEIAREGKSVGGEAQLLSRTALALHDQGRKWRSGRQMEKALALAQQTNDPVVLAQVAQRGAGLYIAQEKWSKATTYAQQAMQLFVQLNDQERVNQLQIMLKEIEREQKNSSGFLF
jgi:serine/threonine protein kinase